MKQLKIIVICMCVGIIGFTLIPTSSSGSDIITGFKKTTVASEVTTQGQLVSLYQIIAEGDEQLAEDFAGSMREAIVDLGVTIAWEYGNGLGDRPATQIFYEGVASSKRAYTSYCHGYLDDGSECKTTSVSAHYGSFDIMWAEYLQVRSHPGTNVHMHGSCAAFATFCQRAVWIDAPWTTGSTTLAATLMGNEVHGDGSCEFIYANAKPGDLLVCGSKADASYTHTILYVGEYTLPDGTKLEHGVAEMSWDTGNSDCKVHELTGRSNVYLIRLEDEIIRLAKGEIVLTEEYANVTPDASLEDSDSSDLGDETVDPGAGSTSNQEPNRAPSPNFNEEYEPY